MACTRRAGLMVMTANVEYIYIIYTPHLGLGIARSNQKRSRAALKGIV